MDFVIRRTHHRGPSPARRSPHLRLRQTGQRVGADHPGTTERLYGWEVPGRDHLSARRRTRSEPLIPCLHRARRRGTRPAAGLFPLHRRSCAPRPDSQRPTLWSKGRQLRNRFRRLRALHLGPRTKVFLLCNPHNPVGRVFRQAELQKLAEICLRNHIVDLLRRDPLRARLSGLITTYPSPRSGPEVAAQTITLMSPSKTFNIAGLGSAFAVIKSPDIRKSWNKWSQGLVPHVNIMGNVATLAAFKDGQEWLDQALAYLTANRDFMATYVEERLPGLRMARMEATYLAWLDCRHAGIPGRPSEFFLKEAGVGLNDGAEFGAVGAGFVRLNFACPRETLVRGPRPHGRCAKEAVTKTLRFIRFLGILAAGGATLSPA